MKKIIKKHFPLLFEYLKHLQRLREIRSIEALKKLPFNELIKRVEMSYASYIGKKLDWTNLETYTAKMQWEKLFNQDSLKTTLSDKLSVRNWIEKTIGAEYLIPVLGSWDSYDEIDFDSLPDSFVLKTNHGSGTNLIIRNKSKLNHKIAKMMFDDWMKMDFGYRQGLEIHYSPIVRKIFAEKYMETSYGELQDYKFLCFGGKPYFCWVDMGRYTNHTRNVYDLNWVLQPWNQEMYGNYPHPIPKPENFDKMIELSTILSHGFAHVRVDLYNIDGQIYFGEMTFTNGRGLDRIIPEQYDKMLGNLWHLPKTEKL